MNKTLEDEGCVGSSLRFHFACEIVMRQPDEVLAIYLLLLSSSVLTCVLANHRLNDSTTPYIQHRTHCLQS